LVYGCPEAFGREGSKPREKESFGLVFGTEQQADRGAGADLANGTPKRE